MLTGFEKVRQVVVDELLQSPKRFSVQGPILPYPVQNGLQCVAVPVPTSLRIIIPAYGATRTGSGFFTCGVPAARCPDQGPPGIEDEFDFVRVFCVELGGQGVVLPAGQFKLEEFFLHFSTRSDLSAGEDTQWPICRIVTVQGGTNGDLLDLGAAVGVPIDLMPSATFRSFRRIAQAASANMDFISVQELASGIQDIRVFCELDCGFSNHEKSVGA